MIGFLETVLWQATGQPIVPHGPMGPCAQWAAQWAHRAHWIHGTLGAHGPFGANGPNGLNGPNGPWLAAWLAASLAG